ncbi:MAG: hypothetical protein MK108_08290 [Mariniblastus sp.]|nr:hypothetical protein [Mariniblastus sp.]
MTDLKNPKWIYGKGFLFLVILIVASGLILYEAGSWKIGLLLALAIWAAARLYYFMFYVIEHYVDQDYKFAGISSFLQYLVTRKNG